MAVLIDSNFPGGGVEDVRIVSQSHVFFSAPVDGSLSNRTCWFCFRVRGGKGRDMTFHQEKMERTLEVNIYGTYAVVRPVVREEGGEWKRLSSENVTYDRESLDFSFRYTPESDETYFAFCYPYQLSDLKAFFAGYRGNEHVREISLGRTYENREYPAYILGCDDEKPGKKLVFLKSRQHSGETSGSFVLEGVMQQILADDALGRALREKALFFVVPMVHLDGVENGHYGKDAPPVDFNRDWRRNSKRQEIRAIVSKLDELTRKYPMVVSADFHSPHPGGPSHIMPARFSDLGKDGWDRMCQFRAYVEELMEPFSSNRVCDLEDIYFSWPKENYPFMESTYCKTAWGADGFIAEIAYHCDRTGRPIGPEQWNKMGHAYARAIYDIWLNEEFHYDYDPATLPNLEKTWDQWAMVAIPENITIQEDGDELLLEAHRGYERTYIPRKAFVASKKIVSSGRYEVCCEGQAKLDVFSYFYEDGVPGARSDALKLVLENEKVTISCKQLCSENKSDIAYHDMSAAFRVFDLDGVLHLRWVP